jgi:hypothetical protein
LLTVRAQNSPGRQTSDNQDTSGNREDDSRPASAIFTLKLQEIAVARAARGQVIQV